MSRYAIITVASVILGFMAGAWFMFESPGDGVVPAAESAQVGVDSQLSDRLAGLEVALEQERSTREVLEEQLLMIIEQLDGQAGPIGAASARLAQTNGVGGSVQRRIENRQRDAVTRMQKAQERRVAMFVENGYSEDEARRLLRLESEAQFTVMQALHDSQRTGERFDPFSSMTDTQSIVREKLGEAQYERFLVAQGQRTNVQISNILDGSPGSRAGLRPRDEIISYNGRRTYSMSDLHRLTMSGQPGEEITIEVDRDGVRMQLSIPRGPIGMNGNGASVNMMNWWGG